MKFYKRMEGRIGSDPLVLHLIRNDSLLWGTYTYPKGGMPVQLQGQISGDGKVLLEEIHDTAIIRRFDGRMLDEHSFFGRWSDSAHGRILSFSCKEHYTSGSVRLKLISWMGEHTPKGAGPEGMAHYSAILLQADTTAGRKVAERLNRYLAYNETSSAGIRPLFQIRTHADTFFRTYDSTYRAGEEKNFDAPYEHDFRPIVYLNDNYILSVGYSTYEYTGGIHGGEWISVKSMSLRDGHVFSLSDFFWPGYEQSLRRSAEQELKKKLGLVPGSDLVKDSVLKKPLQLTDNFYLSPWGIGFLYNPYELDYRPKEISEILVPYESLKGWIRPKGPLGWTLKK